MLRERPLVVDRARSCSPAPVNCTRPGSSSPSAEPGVRRDRRVEALGRLRGRGRGSTGGRRGRRARRPRGRRVHRLDAVAVRVEQEPAVVVGPYCVRGPGAPSSRYPASIPACQKASTACARSARGSRRAARGSPGARGPSARCPSRPTRRARRPHGWARRPARRGRCGRSARTRRGPRRRCRRGRTPRRGYRFCLIATATMLGPLPYECTGTTPARASSRCALGDRRMARCARCRWWRSGDDFATRVASNAHEHTHVPQQTSILRARPKAARR